MRSRSRPGLGGSLEPSFAWKLLTDAHAAIRFLADAFGFERVAVYETGRQVDHAELRWPLGGGVMLGSASREDSSIAGLPPGTGSVYVVTDDVDAQFKHACAAGATAAAKTHKAEIHNAKAADKRMIALGARLRLISH